MHNIAKLSSYCSPIRVAVTYDLDYEQLPYQHTYIIRCHTAVHICGKGGYMNATEEFEIYRAYKSTISWF